MPSFQDALNQKVGDFERPKVLPVGSYLCVVSEQPKPDKARNKKTGEEWDVVNFSLKILQPMGDVDPLAYQEATANTPPLPLKFTKFVNDARGFYYLQEDLKNAFQVPEGITMGEALAQCVGKQVIATIKHSPSADGKTLNANVEGIAAAA